MDEYAFLFDLAADNPCSRLFTQIIISGYSENDQEYLNSPLFSQHSKLAGIDPELIKLLYPTPRDTVHPTNQKNEAAFG